MAKITRLPVKQKGESDQARPADKDQPDAPSSAVGAAHLAIKLHVDELDDRQKRGAILAAKIAKGKARVADIGDERSIYWSTKNDARAYELTRLKAQVRGVKGVVRRCDCADFKKNGRIDCLHIFADRIRRKEVIIEGKLSSKQSLEATAIRRPTRKQFTADGRSHRTVQKIALTKMPKRVPDLIFALRRADELHNPSTSNKEWRDRVHAQALILKIAHGVSANAMISVYEDYIESGIFCRTKPPCQNTLTAWMNDPALTPILRRYLNMTVQPFRKSENTAILDSTFFSQLRTASYRLTTYGPNEAEGAEWLQCNVISGAETNVVMDVIFSPKRTHDSFYLTKLVESALRTFTLKNIIGDKGYLSGPNIGWLHRIGLRGFIPVKKGWRSETKEPEDVEACTELVERYDNHQRDFHEVYRLRVKIEGIFSVVKRVADGHCWSRGRVRTVESLEGPRDAWTNELLCKFIYVNLRATVTREAMTGYDANYLIPDKFFPAPAEPLVAEAA
jgi:hypothetical protein